MLLFDFNILLFSWLTLTLYVKNYIKLHLTELFEVAVSDLSRMQIARGKCNLPHHLCVQGSLYFWMFVLKRRTTWHGTLV